MPPNLTDRETGKKASRETGEQPIIIGGGFAGVAAACRLAGDGYRPLLLERAPRLGGRAASFDDPITGQRIDYGHHVSMRCCTATDGLLRRIGAGDAIEYQEPLSVPTLCGDARAVLQGSLWLPGLLHLAPALLRHRCLSPTERWQAGRAALALMLKRRRSDVSFGRWLRSHGQCEGVIAKLWDPICIATLNAHVDQVSLKAARHVLHDGFFDPGGAGMGFFRRPLGDLFETAAAYIESHGGEVCCGSGVRAIRFEDAGCRLELADGEHLVADRVIAAIPPWDLARIVDDVRLKSTIDAADRLTWAPIVDVYLWFDRSISDDAFFVAVESPVQAAFDLSRIHDPAGDSGHQIVISLSAAGPWLDRSPEAIGDELIGELHRLLPAARSARVERQLVLKHRRATFVPAPGTDPFRPDPKTPIDRLVLAGDWTATGWPSTIEGAIRSGVSAAGRLASELPDLLESPEDAAALDPSPSAP